eukprot:13420472-Ditylum_brightwellii.AAC.1
MKNSAQYYKDNGNNWCCLYQDSSRKCSSKYSKEELNTIIGKNTKEALKKECCKPHAKKMNFIDKFNALSISSIDNSDDNSCT